MFGSLHSFLDTIEKIETPPFSLRDIPGFPYDEYNDRIGVYTEAESWYSGKILDVTQTVNGKEVETYPVRINPIRTAVQKHTFALFGEVGEDDRPLVSARVLFKDDEQKVMAEEAENVLDQIWYESSGRAIQWQNGALSQIYGGCIFKIAYDPLDQLRTYPLRIENPLPHYFIGRPSAVDFNRLKEAWFIRPISQEEAKENGYVGDFTNSFETPWLVEHYTDFLYDAFVNNQPVKRFTSSAPGSPAAWVPVSGPNKWGFVPAVYIPHIRVAGFYGENMFDQTKGVVKELNLRVADYGDAVCADAHAYKVMSDVNGSPTVVTVAPGVSAINIGNTMSFGNSSGKPSLTDLGTQRSSETMQKLVEMLYDQFRRDCFVPKVVDGEDEGSQRSGLTLAMRMLSLLWHTQSERVFWSAGLNLLNRMLLRICATSIPSSGITIQHATLRSQLDWAPVLPRDREMLISEVVARAGAYVSSPDTLFRLLGDIQDADVEEKGILDFQKRLAEAMASAQPKVSPDGDKNTSDDITAGSKTRSASEKSGDKPKPTEKE